MVGRFGYAGAQRRLFAIERFKCLALTDVNNRMLVSSLLLGIAI